MLVNVAFIFEEVGTLIHYQATLYLVDAFLNGTIIIKRAAAPSARCSATRPRKIVATIFEVVSSL